MRIPSRVLAIAVGLLLPLAGETVRIPSSMDGSPQPAIVDVPSTAEANPTPLLVHLHSWSTRFDNSTNFADVRAETAKRGWIFLSPDFRGANNHPAACGSELSVQDVLDAVDWVKQRAKVDERRIYLVGVSGGGYMSLMMAGRAPRVWAAVSAWVPISDLVEWHSFSVRKPQRYAKDMEACFSGYPPTHGFALQQYRRRSPVNFLELARGLPLDINTGIKDGHTGSVPVSHSLRAFNQLADAPARISDADIDAMVRDAAVPERLRARALPDEGRSKPVLFRRVSGAARVSVFDGGHEPDFPAALRWLEQHRKPQPAIHTTLQDNQLLPRQADGKAAIPEPVAFGHSGAILTRINGGPWLTRMPRLAAGGPYTIEHRAGLALIRRTGILAGDLYILAGQSNMVGRAPLVNPAPPDPRVRVLTPEDVWRIARDPIHEALFRDGRTLGIGLGLTFAKEMVRRTGVPVGLIPCAVGGTSLAQWDPERQGEFRRSLYGNLLARAKLAGGPIKAVLWYQGETDAEKSETAAVYGDLFESLVKAIRSGLAQPDVPFYYAQLSRYVIDKGYEGWDAVREAQRLAEHRIQPGGMIATNDLTLTDPIHLDRAALETVGRRFSARILDGPAPKLKSVRWEGAARLRLSFEPRLAPIAASTRIHGFELNRPAVFDTRMDAATGDILLSIGPGVAPHVQSLFYCRGLNPICGLLDANGQALPSFGPITLDAPPAK